VNSVLSLRLDRPWFIYMFGRPRLVDKLGFMVVLINNNVNLVLLYAIPH
jgi:hypothetical protein